MNSFRCVVVGGGPAGMMTGLLLARQGIDVAVLEKHADFFRDFRGDTIHPTTMEVLDELGLIEEFLRLPHRKMTQVTMDTPAGSLTFADFTRLVPYGFIAFVPQWDFLDLLASAAARLPNFRRMMSAEVVDLLEEDGRIRGVRARTQEGVLDIPAELVIGADGRHSVVRRRAGLEVASASTPIDVLWFRVSRRDGDEVPFFRKTSQSVLVSIDRGDYWQLAYVIPSGMFEVFQRDGLSEFRERIIEVAPGLADRVAEITDWDKVKLLSVRVDRLRRWYRPGLLCIGDAAHAMSPAGGVGINLAIQDAVAAARILGPTFARRGPTIDHLRRVQRRRALPTRVVQAFQRRILRGLYPTATGVSVESDRGEPMAVRLVRRFPALRHVAGWFIGRGVRREHVGTGGRSVPAGAIEG